MSIYISDNNWDTNHKNPFNLTGEYGNEWSCINFSDEIEGEYSFNNPTGKLFILTLNPRFSGWKQRLCDFIGYENHYFRTVIVKPYIEEDIAMILKENINSSFNSNEVRKSDPNWLVHSTTKRNWESIQKSGFLKSIRVLKDEGYKEIGIGLAPFGEPDDYEDYIMFDNLYGCSELVVNSRNLGRICLDGDVAYEPGVRMYFDAHRMIEDGLAIRDGAHILKVKGRFEIADYLVDKYDVDSLELPEGQEYWTPSTFTDETNKTFIRKSKI